MKSECLAIHPNGPLKFRHKHCEQCQKETLHRGNKCGLCGDMIPMGVPPGRFNAASFRWKLAQKRTTNEKRAAFRRSAEESRKKFEGS